MDRLSDTWKRLQATSAEKRDLQEDSRKGKYRVRKAAEDAAVQLARDESKLQWDLRAEADKFLASNGFTSGGKRRGARKIPGL